ncbi:MAG: hypothetical protein HOP29_07150 [Phycisphaerales bacterium]|nr:hypothetical protein [Phycisphaerales bacterium]
MVRVIGGGSCVLMLLCQVAAGQPKMSLKPVGGVGNNITVAAGSTVVLEVFISDVAPTGLRGYQSTLPFSATGGVSGTMMHNGVVPVVNTGRADYVFAGVTSFPTAAIGPPPRLAAGVFAGDVQQVSAAEYAGEFTYLVSNDAVGDFTLAFQVLPPPAPTSALANPANQAIAGVLFIPAVIHVPCLNNGQCNNGLFCDGPETCVLGNCVPGTPPCVVPTPFCNEVADECVQCNTSAECEDGNACTQDVCTLGTCSFPPEGAGTSCGNSLDDGCTNPDTCDGAGACSPNHEPNGTGCDDGLFCNTGETCTVGVCGGGSANSCNDSRACTLDSCDENGDACLHNVIAGTCYIDDVCYLNGETNPTNECQSCNSAMSAIDWTNDPNGAACATDGLTCTSDQCQAGVCDHALQGGTCLIGGVCFNAGNLNPGNDCENCDPGSATTDWSFVADGTGCAEDGNTCTADECLAGACDHANHPIGTLCDDGDPCTGTGGPGVDDDMCDGLGTCVGDLDTNCADDCANSIEAFEGANFGSNVGFGPDDTEASCQPNSNHDAWFEFTALCDGTMQMTTTGSTFTPSNDTVLSVFDECDGTEIACDDDSGEQLLSALVVFNAVAGHTYFIRVAGFDQNVGGIQLNIRRLDTCRVDDVCYDAGVTNPGNTCEECQPVFSTTAWTPAMLGKPCGDPGVGECDSADACDGAGFCEDNHKPDGIACLADANECTDDICLAGLCEHPFEASGFACGDPFDSECDNPDTCDGAGVCVDNLELPGFTCGDPLDSDCDNPDTCDGVGVCEDHLEPDGLACTSDFNDCTNDFCDAGFCTHPNSDEGTSCGDPTDTDCDNPDTCNGLGTCLDHLELDGTVCSDQNVCTGPDLCATGICIAPFIPETPLLQPSGARAMIVTAQPGGSPIGQALRVTSPELPCLLKYVDVDGTLVDSPVEQSAAAWGTIVVRDTEVVPETKYEVAAVCGGDESPAASVETGKWGDVNNDTFVDIFDILCVLDGFAGVFTNCPFETVDMSPCVPDGVIDIFDILMILSAFQGDGFPCIGPCGGGACCHGAVCTVVASGALCTGGGVYQGNGISCEASPCGSPSPAGAAGVVMVRLVPSREVVQGGEMVTVDVYADGLNGLIGYQLAVEVVGGRRGRLEPKSVVVDGERDRFAFSGLQSFQAGDLAGQRLAVAVTPGTPTRASGGYLGTFSYRASADAQGVFIVRLRPAGGVMMLDSAGLDRGFVADSAQITIRAERSGQRSGSLSGRR